MKRKLRDDDVYMLLPSLFTEWGIKGLSITHTKKDRWMVQLAEDTSDLGYGKTLTQALSRLPAMQDMLRAARKANEADFYRAQSA